jgi:hypothetical protein
MISGGVERGRSLREESVGFCEDIFEIVTTICEDLLFPFDKKLENLALFIRAPLFVELHGCLWSKIPRSLCRTMVELGIRWMKVDRDVWFPVVTE